MATKLTDEEVEQGLVAGALRRYKNGAIADAATGKIIQSPPPENRAITKETARQMHQLRREKAIEAARRGLAEGADPDRRSSLKAWQTIIAAQARMAADEDRGRSSTVAAEFVGKAVGYLRNTDEIPAAGSQTGQVPADLALKLAELAMALRENKLVIDVDPKDC